MARKFVYRGLELEALQKMSIEDFLKLIPANKRRTLRRMGFQIKKVLSQFRKHKKAASQKPFRTHVRQMVIIPEMVGSRIQVHMGNAFNDVLITTEMLGHRLGEYAHPAKLVKHSGPGIGATRGSKSVELK
ncbi:MAG: 30S ribosomal protein S19 [Candidatus Micrarchaeota archaeon]